WDRAARAPRDAAVVRLLPNPSLNDQVMRTERIDVRKDDPLAVRRAKCQGPRCVAPRKLAMETGDACRRLAEVLALDRMRRVVRSCAMISSSGSGAAPWIRAELP